MFSKAALTFLAIGALSVNAMTVPVAREPAPEPEIQQLEARIIPLLIGGASAVIGALSSKKGKREFLDELFSREFQDWAEYNA